MGKPCHSPESRPFSGVILMLSQSVRISLPLEISDHDTRIVAYKNAIHPSPQS